MSQNGKAQEKKQRDARGRATNEKPAPAALFGEKVGEGKNPKTKGAATP